MASLFKQRVAEGRCGKCDTDNPDGGSLCPICREAARLKAAKEREEAKAKGLCPGCKKRPLANSRKKCQVCLDYQAKKQAEKSKESKAKGFCPSCNKRPAKEGCTCCQTCITRMSANASRRFKERRKKGLCGYCDSLPIPGGSLCKRHQLLYKDYRYKLKLEVLEHYGMACEVCGHADPLDLEIDHKHGGGRKHLREIGLPCSGYSFYLWLRRNNFPDGFRVLCPTHNKRAYRDLPPEEKKRLQSMELSPYHPENGEYDT